jgi:hypothetical protein
MKRTGMLGFPMAAQNKLYTSIREDDGAELDSRQIGLP